MSWRRLENVMKKSWRCLEDVFARLLEGVLKTFWRRLGNTSWRRLENVLKTYEQDDYVGLDQDVFKTSSEDVWVRRIHSLWSRRLEVVFRRRRQKTSSGHLQDVFIKTNVCWLKILFAKLTWDKKLFLILDPLYGTSCLTQLKNPNILNTSKYNVKSTIWLE